MSDLPASRAVEAGARAFLAAMRREHVRRYPERDCRVPTYDDLAPADRTSLSRATAEAMRAALSARRVDA